MTVVIIVGYSSFSMGRLAIGLYKENSEGEAKIQDLSAEKADLEARISEFKTPSALEREAKERLNLKRQGEEVVVVLPEKDNEVATTSPGILRRILELLNIK